MSTSKALRTKLQWIMGFITATAFASIVLLGISGYLGARAIRASAEALSVRGITRVSELSDLRAQLFKFSVAIRDITVATSAAKRTELAAVRNKIADDFTALFNSAKEGHSAASDEEFKKLDANISKYLSFSAKMDAAWKGDKGDDLSRETRETLAEILANDFSPLRRAADTNILALTKLEIEDQAAIERISKETYVSTLSGLFLVMAIGVAFPLFCFFFAVRYLKRINKGLERAAQVLRKSSEAVDASSQSVATSATQLASSTTEEASSIAETAASMEEMTATIAKTLQNVTTALEVSEEGQIAAATGGEVVGKMILAMNEIQASNGKLEKMIKLIEEIKEKTRVINDIVSETRLLSFNASIEAARAGSQGKGFAVVAEEVGNLAAISGKAADEIRGLLESSTSEVNEIVRSTQDRINQGRSKAEECEKAFHSMGETLSRVCQFVKGISAAAHEQNAGVNQINSAIGQLDTVTQSNAAEAEGLDGSAKSLSTEAERLSDSVAKLSTIIFGEREDGEDDEDEIESSRGLRRGKGGKSAARTPTKTTALKRPVNEARPSHSARTSAATPDAEIAEGVADREDPRWRGAA